MTLLEDLLGTITGGSGKLDSSAIGKLLGDLFERNGGLEGLMRMFSQSGLGDSFASWVGSGENQAVSAGQLKSTLGHDQLSALAERLGIDPDQTSGILAETLPQVIDRMTPGGELGGRAGRTDDLGSLLADLFGDTTGRS